MAVPPEWLGANELRGHLLGHSVESPADLARAAEAYAQLVTAGRDVNLWAQGLNRQIYLGDDDFVQRMQDAAAPSRRSSRAVPKVQRSLPRTFKQWLARCTCREEALLKAHAVSGLTMTSLAAELGLTPARVGQLIALAERRGQGEGSVC